MIGFLRAWQQQQASVKYGLLFGTLRRCNSTLGCANYTGTHAEAGWDRLASRGTQNIRSAQAICAALSPHIKNPKSGTRMLQFSPPWMESNSSPHSQNVTLPLQQIKSEAQTYNLLPGHSFIHSFSRSGHGSPDGSFRRRRRRKIKRTRLWTVGDASVLTPFQPPPILNSSQRTGYRHKNELVPGAKGGCTNQCPISPHHHYHPFSGPGTSWHPCPPFWGIDHRVQSYHLAKRLLFPRPKGFH